MPDGFVVVELREVVEPDVLPVPVPVVDPPIDEPVVPPLTDELPAVEPAPVALLPLPVCASANVPDSANAAAKAIVVNFIVRSLLRCFFNPTPCERLMFRLSRASESSCGSLVSLRWASARDAPAGLAIGVTKRFRRWNSLATISADARHIGSELDSVYASINQNLTI